MSAAVHAPCPSLPEAAPAPLPDRRPQIDSLTSLRFVAAAAIVVGHTRGAYGFPADFAEKVNVWAAVPFFFVLSGFILTYRYPTLDESGARRFLVARVARLWPGHAAVFLLALLPLVITPWPGQPGDTLPAALAFLAMVHAWVPYQDSYFAFNAVTWSISVELAFYLLFPILIQGFRRRWPIVLCGAVLVFSGVVQLSAALALPPSRPGQPGPDSAGLLVFGPWPHFYLFVLGMVACLAWQWLAPRLRPGIGAATILELAAVGFTAWTLNGVVTLPMLTVPLIPWIGPTAWAWIPPIQTTAASFPLLIVVMALGRGHVARFLTWPLCILGGEISYALYLVHLPLNLLIALEYPKLGGILDPFGWLVYWLIALVLAWVLWRFVEWPLRRRIRDRYRRREYALSQGQWRAVGGLIAVGVALILAMEVMTLR